MVFESNEHARAARESLGGDREDRQAGELQQLQPAAAVAAHRHDRHRARGNQSPRALRAVPPEREPNNETGVPVAVKERAERAEGRANLHRMGASLAGFADQR